MSQTEKQTENKIILCDQARIPFRSFSYFFKSNLNSTNLNFKVGGKYPDYFFFSNAVIRIFRVRIALQIRRPSAYLARFVPKKWVGVFQP